MGSRGRPAPSAGEAALLAPTLPLGRPGPTWGQAEAVRLHAAGTLREALTKVSRALAAAYGVPYLSPEGQAILVRHGFTAPRSPGG